MAETTLKQRVKQFDECFLELSTEAQNDLTRRIHYAFPVLVDGGGEMSIKELIFQLARFMERTEKLIGREIW